MAPTTAPPAPTRVPQEPIGALWIPLEAHRAIAPPKGSHIWAQKLFENIWAKIKRLLNFRPHVFNKL